MARWYIIHAYSGFENKVREQIVADAQRLGLEALVESVEVPTETVTEVRRGKKVEYVKDDDALARYVIRSGTEGLVLREVSAEDRRSFRISLTDKGRQDFEEAAAMHERWVVDLFSGLATAERTQLNDLLGRLRQHLSASIRGGEAGPA